MSARPPTSRTARTLAVLVLVGMGLLGRPGAARAEEAPDPAANAPAATLTFRGRGATIGVGFVWGSSTLDFKGQQYPVRVDGFVLGAIGAIAIEATGEVYGLTKPEDLNGDYTAFSGGGTFGIGSSRLVMRNDKGVRVVMDARTSGLQLGIGPRGITLQVGKAGDPPASDRARLPRTLGFGDAAFGAFSFRPTLNAQIVGFAEGNSGFNGEWSAGPLEDADVWFETSNEVGLNALYDAGRHGSVKGRVSGVFSLTGGGIDAAASNGSEINNHQYSLESAYLEWQSGNLLPELGFNGLEIGGGNQNYQVFDGLLFWDGGQDGGVRGASWLSPRKAFRETGIVRLNTGGLVLEGVHLKYNDDPDSNTRLAAGRVEYATDDWVMAHFRAGIMYFNIYESERASRDGMNGFYFYHEATPIRAVPNLTYTMSFVEEINSELSGLRAAYGWYAAPAYQVSSLPWKPQIIYRYASFSGGGTRSFDSLFTGLPEWGSWFQGELLGEFVLSNNNLNSHQVRLEVEPNDVVTLNFIYYRFLLGHEDQGFGVTPSRVGSSSLAEEYDVILDVALANWWSITAEFTIAVPDEGFRQAVGGSSTWINSMLYMNFNF